MANTPPSTPPSWPALKAWQNSLYGKLSLMPNVVVSGRSMGKSMISDYYWIKMRGDDKVLSYKEAFAEMMKRKKLRKNCDHKIVKVNAGQYRVVTSVRFASMRPAGDPISAPTNPYIDDVKWLFDFEGYGKF